MYDDHLATACDHHIYLLMIYVPSLKYNVLFADPAVLAHLLPATFFVAFAPLAFQPVGGNRCCALCKRILAKPWQLYTLTRHMQEQTHSLYRKKKHLSEKLGGCLGC